MHFDAEQSALVLPSSLLKHPIGSADPILYRHLEREAAEIHATQCADLVANLRALLRTSMPSHPCDANSIAMQLGMHERTLNRRLREEGTDYREVLEAMRFEISRQMLANPDMPASRIAEALNYADVTAFSRAFKRWSGESPTRWRARHG